MGKSTATSSRIILVTARSCPICDALSKAAEYEIRDCPADCGHKQCRLVGYHSGDLPKKRPAHNFDQMIERIEAHDKTALRTGENFGGPEDRRDEQAHLYHARDELLHVTKPQAEHAQQQRRPYTI